MNKTEWRETLDETSQRVLYRIVINNPDYTKELSLLPVDMRGAVNWFLSAGVLDGAPDLNDYDRLVEIEAYNTWPAGCAAVVIKIALEDIANTMGLSSGEA